MIEFPLPMKRLPLALVFVLLLTGAFLRHASSQSNFTQQLAPGVFYRAADRPKNIIANAGWIVFRDVLPTTAHRWVSRFLATANILRPSKVIG